MTLYRVLITATVLTAFSWAMLSTPAFAVDKKAERLWRAKCASCHGKDGTGKTKQGEKMGVGDMTAAAWQKQFTDDKIKETVLSGFKREKAGKKQEMKSFKGKLKPDQIAALVAFVRGLSK